MNLGDINQYYLVQCTMESIGLAWNANKMNHSLITREGTDIIERSLIPVFN